MSFSERRRTTVWALAFLAVMGAWVGGAEAQEKSGPDIKIGGYVKVDFIQDYDAIGNASQFQVNSIPVSGTAAADQSGRTTIQAKETRLTLTLLDDTSRGKFKAYVEGDFYGDNNGFRIRHAYGEYGEFLGGQTWTTFMDFPTRPRTLDYEGPDAEIFVRQAMVRWTHPLSKKMTLALAVEQPGGQFVIPTALTGSSRSNVPDVPANLRFATGRGHVQFAAIARQIRFDGESGSPDVTTTGFGVNLSFRLNTFGKDAVMGEFAFGDGISRYIESFSGQNVDAVFVSGTEMEALEASAAVLGYEHHWSETLESSIAFSWAALEEDARLSPSTIELTQDFRLNVIWAADKKVDVGGEVLWGEREDQDGADGDAWRLQLAMFYKLL